MALYAQHGHAKSEKIVTALDANILKGVVFSPRNELPENLIECITNLHSNHDADLLIDPQFYIAALPRPKEMKLIKYGYYPGELSAADFIGSKNVKEFVKKTIDEQIVLGADAVISPTVIFDSFDDRWYQIALTLADASLEYHSTLDGPPRLLLNFVFSETVLNDLSNMKDFLNQITAWEKAAGVYLIISRTDPTYSQQIDEVRLTNYLYLVHFLSKNDIEVICGYTDFLGILLRAVGAKAFATGWYNNLRQFHKSAFTMRDQGGQLPRPRYSSSKLFNSILLSELHLAFEADLLSTVLSEVSTDAVISAAPAGPSSIASEWAMPVSCQHHWETLAQLDNQITGDVAVDLDRILDQLDKAKGIYLSLRRAGIPFENSSNEQHLDILVNSINNFRALISL